MRRSLLIIIVVIIVVLLIGASLLLMRHSNKQQSPTTTPSINNNGTSTPITKPQLTGARTSVPVPMRNASEYQNITINEIAKNPDQFNNVLVRITGTYLYGSEQSFLTDTSVANKQLLWFSGFRTKEAYEKSGIADLKNQHPEGKVPVIIEGQIFTKGGYGIDKKSPYTIIPDTFRTQ